MKLPLKETLITGCCIAILCGLGTWQVARLQWKEDIISKLENQYNAPSPRAFETAQLDALTKEEMPLAYGQAQGYLLREKSILLGPRSENGRMGYHLLIPLEMKDGKALIINAGWVGDLWKDNTEERLAVLPVQEVTVRGIIHKPDWNSFTSKNSPDNDLWFRADINEIAAAKDIEKVYPFILYADRVSPSLNDVAPHEEKWLPRNKHLQYALFWYALAIVMAAVYGVYIYGQNKSPTSNQ